MIWLTFLTWKEKEKKQSEPWSGYKKRIYSQRGENPTGCDSTGLSILAVHVFLTTAEIDAHMPYTSTRHRNIVVICKCFNF